MADELLGAEDALPGLRHVPQDRPITLAGMIASVAPMITKRGDRMARFMLEDLEGSMEMILFPRSYESYGELLREDNVIQVTGFFETSDRGAQVKVNSIKEIRLSKSAERLPQVLELRYSASVFNQTFSDELSRLLEGYAGIDPVVILLEREGAAPLRAEMPFTVDGQDSRLKARLAQLALGVGVRETG
jgi:DNA polymerase-3 subunit alpha